MPSPRCSPLVALSPYTQATLSLTQSRPPSSVDVPFLRAQLDSLESTLSTLLDQRLLLTARLTEAVALTSPIRLLSNELLSVIFVASTLPSHSSSPRDAPALLSTLMLVCKQWRDICLCTPDLWSRISISPNEPESFEKARRRLVRSKAVPLHVFLDFSPRSSFSAQAATQHSAQCLTTPDHLLKTSLQLLRPTIARWRSFVLLVPYRPQATAALALCSSPAPMLESLTIQVSNPMLHAIPLEWDGDRSHGARTFLPFRGVTPRLRECSLTSFWCERPEDLAPTPSPSSEDPISGPDPGMTPRMREFSGERLAPDVHIWTGRTRMIFPGVGRRLTKLRLVGFWNDFAPNVDEMVGLLRQCPLLEELKLRNMSDVDPADDELSVPAASPIVMRHLRHLSFYYSGVARTCILLHRTALPALERLELSFLDNITACLKHLRQQAASRYGYDYDYAHGYESEHGHSQSSEAAHFPIKTLRIEASLFNELKLLRLLRRLPTLERLELVDVEDVSSNLLKGLSAPVQPNEWILPQLVTLNLEGCTSVEWEDLKALVESRLPSSSASSSAAASSTRRILRSGHGVSSSASEYARGKAMAETPYTGLSSLARMDSSTHELRVSAMAALPQKLMKLDLTRCSQISRERVQWLRMYVGDVVCENGKGGWAGSEGVV
ncbi:hypothetical protein JB92DRAFT_2829054 [Gautieria morchelliformis]|nr:hypothetical protein JB92DRAFT_2829054 [Gautieria morchelliformis]